MSAHYGDGRTGGVITLFGRDDVFALYVQAEVGTPDPSKLRRYHTISLEKADRAARFGQFNSWVTDRDPEQGQYGGAFAIPSLNVYISFSGWKEQDDIVFAAYVLLRAELIREEDVNRIFRQHDGICYNLTQRWEEFVDVFEAVPV